MTERSLKLGELPGWPRLLSAEEAARYVGVSRNLFSQEVTQGIWPAGLPRGIKGGKMTWDRFSLDRRIDSLMGAGNEEDDGFTRRRRNAPSRRQGSI